MTKGAGILSPPCPFVMSSLPWFLDLVGWLFFNGAQRARENWGEPGMLMKIKQLSKESKIGPGVLQEPKRMKLNGLSILVIGNHGEENR